MAIRKLLAPLVVDGAEADEEGGGAGGDGLERRGDEGAVMEGSMPHGRTRGSEVRGGSEQHHGGKGETTVSGGKLSLADHQWR